MRRLVLLVCLAACSGDEPYDGGHPDGGSPIGPGLMDLPEVIAMPYVDAGVGPSTLELDVYNVGNEEAHLVWGLAGVGFELVSAPEVIPGGSGATVIIRWDGSPVEAIAQAMLTVSGDANDAAEVWAAAGDPALGEATFEPVENGGGIIGASAVVSMPTAPYPAPGRPWTDDRVHVFVPLPYSDADANDVVLHFHGHNTTIDATIPAHRYREQVHASGANVVLVVPQGPVNAASGDFGKLSDPANTEAFLQEVLIVLFRAELIVRPVLGDVILTSHSGGYIATAQNLGAAFHVRQVQLYDSVYGNITTFRDYALAGGRLRSNYTSTGGTDANNMTLANQLGAMGASVNAVSTTDALASDDPLIYATPSTHEGSTREADAYTEQLRWGARHGRRGPRVELRSAVAEGDTATVTWRAPADTDVTGWRVVKPNNDVLAEVDADATTATFPSPGRQDLRVMSIVGDDDPGTSSDTYEVYDTGVLVVDGFDRVIDGSFRGLTHDFAARVAAAAGGANSASNEAITEDGFDLSAYRVVIWLVGDDSTDDHTFTDAERTAISAYLSGGGRVILSGSEIGYELAALAPAFLSSVAGATYAADDANSNSAHGVGPLASITDFAFGDDNAPYSEEYPDTFTGTALLAYSTGATAAVGIAGRAAIVGFPLETISDATTLAAVITALIDFVDP